MTPNRRVGVIGLGYVAFPLPSRSPNAAPPLLAPATASGMKPPGIGGVAHIDINYASYECCWQIEPLQLVVEGMRPPS